ncbi:patatin [Paucihalobacter ruber]|uniref:Patatin n=1 Tax=Paucihalobacter ruber TaxID=2567861 RepID=A0A506PR64_9FLAO|nr:patatin-like phospholipase family protein [Paucihalobacter ruber]TPV34710.1 patatin [Paucihalobacter ruber]
MRYIVIILSLFLFFPALHAQEDQEPKIGLVLSGGGAKGFAHIGVLKVIDSLGIKVDYVAGTSMGAIIGSLYASGYSGKQLDSIFNSTDFDVLINDRFPRASASLTERDNLEKYAVTLPFENFKINLPRALSRGQNVYNLLYHLTLHVSDVRDFKDLPIPFFCMTTNIETGQSVLMESGNLVEAVMASGALPSLFQPVNINDELFIDGGVINNFPIEELKAKGVDVIIGVDVQDDLKDREQLTAAQDILLQINNFRTIQAMKNKAILADVYIKPDIASFSVISFSDGFEIIESGQLAALEQLDALKSLVKTKSPVNKPNIVIQDSITIKEKYYYGNKRYTRAYLNGKLKLRQPERISYQRFLDGVTNLVATNNFDWFRYTLEAEDAHNDIYELKANIQESAETTFLRFGLHYDNLYKSAALINFTKKRFLTNNDVLSLDVILGDNSRYNFDYFIDQGFYVSFGINSRYNEFDRNVSADLILDENDPLRASLNKIDAELHDFTNQIYIQTLLAQDFALTGGFEHKNLRIESETLLDANQNDEFVFEDTNYYSIFGTLKLDTYDNRYFPKKGVYFNGDFHWYIGATGLNDDFSNFSIAKADIGYAFSFSKRFAMLLESSGGFQIGSKPTNFLDFAIGGYANNFINNFSTFYGYDYISLTGNSFVKGTITLNYEVFKKSYLIFAANYANIDDNIFTTGAWIESPTYSGYTLGCATETFLGPIEIRYARSPQLSQGFWYFNVGFWF